MPLRITTWNVNSVRLRLDGLARLAEMARPDVFCLQETKVTNDLFPCDELCRLGYPHQLLHGQPGYHGVAILSKIPLEGPQRLDWCDKADCRHAMAVLPGNIELHNLYVPAGGDEPDPELNPKFRHKLEMLAALSEWFRRDFASERRAVLVGDLNIAPLENDVWNHKQLLKVVSHTPIEVAALAELQASHGWVDAVRRFVPPEQRLYTWWSYRARDWSASDRGRRLDHIWVTPRLASQALGIEVMRVARGWPQPSDHVPVTIDLDTASWPALSDRGGNPPDDGRIPLFEVLQTDYLVAHRACWSLSMVNRRPPHMSEPYRTGVPALVKWYNSVKGFGFVQPEDGSPDAFLHASLVAQSGHDDLPEGTALVCDIAEGPRGPQVAAIQSIEPPSQPVMRSRPPRRPGGFGGGGFGGGRGGGFAPAGGGSGDVIEGVVKFFNNEKGFGFVIPDDGSKDVFISARTLTQAGIDSLEAQQRVRVITRVGQKGPMADSVELL